MSRKPVIIDFAKCPYFKRQLLKRSEWLDLEGKIISCSIKNIVNDGLCGLKGDIDKLICETLEADLEDGLLVVGDSFDFKYTPEQEIQIEYLRSLVK